jgi:sugar/nucleoside kinase (ribokinase family)
MLDICCIGHITLDKIITPAHVVNMAGGTSFYFSNALRRMDVNYALVTSLARTEMHFVDDLRNNDIQVKVLISKHTLHFENTYSENMDNRTQKVLQTADPFTYEQVDDIRAKIFHLGPLTANDIPVDLIKSLSEKAKVSIDVQGYLREVKDQQVFAVDWPEKKEALQYATIVKADDSELAVLTGQSDVYEGCRILNEWGVKEVVVTFASRGSLIYFDGEFYTIPAYKPSSEVEDTTGCGDTYMAGYLYQRVKDFHVQEAGEFAAAMAGLKTAVTGPFQGTAADVQAFRTSIKSQIES